MKTAVIVRRTLLAGGVPPPALEEGAVSVGVKTHSLPVNSGDTSIKCRDLYTVDAAPNSPARSLSLSLGGIVDSIQLDSAFQSTSAQRVPLVQDGFVTSLREESNGAVRSYTDFKDRNIPILATSDTLPNLYPSLFM
ncbi:MAG TPA: hypothetical protein ENL23_04980, partial [Candidatus Acetothermia bacterium]|nr:hypothetical protein [Candidatus Acetothermia bacterium]